MGTKNIIALVVHPLTSLVTTMLFLLFASLQPTPEPMRYAIIMTAFIVCLAIVQAFSLPQMLSLKASPTNFGQVAALLGLTLALTAFAIGGGTIWMTPEINLYLAIVAGVVTFVETVTRGLFMLKVKRYGSERYAEVRIARILKGRMCNWNARIDALIKMATGRSIVHDQHARHLAEAARAAMNKESPALLC